MATLHLANEILKIIYPVGSIYMSFSSTSPANLFGGTWTQLKGRFLLGVGTAEDNTSNFYGELRRGKEDYWNGAGSRAGQFYEQLTISEMPSHKPGIDGNWAMDLGGSGWGSAILNNNGYTFGVTHLYSKLKNVGGNAQHNNMPPFITVYMWRRTG